MSFISEIKTLGSDFVPTNWMVCEGQLLKEKDYPKLYAVIGRKYGGDEVDNTFALPDFRNRLAVGDGTIGSGLSSTTYTLGEKGGQTHVPLTVDQLPKHGHTAKGTLKASFVPPFFADSNTPQGKSLGFTSVGTNIYSPRSPNIEMSANSVTVDVEETGANQSIDIRQPYLTVRFIICIEGEFPFETSTSVEE